ncbi:MAG TPA: hypothetical protein VMU17_00920, partial [Elusimicrobiota bacterium]|nr:hypothetical protein [Elusimicrobiota bacterium]
RYRKVQFLLSVSAVGFNRDHSEALVHVDHFCGALCGGGETYFLVKENHQWKLSHTVEGFWVS